MKEVKMHNETISEKSRKMMEKIGKAVAKGVGEDIRTYLMGSDNATNNAVVFLRGDYINTNLVNSIKSDTVEIRYFKRSAWQGCIVIDHDNRLTFSVTSKNTLERIPQKKNRQSPHFLQTLVNTENKGEVGTAKQMSLSDYDLFFGSMFTEEEYEDDFQKIMDDALSLDEDYRHWVIEYEVKHNTLINLTAKLLDGDFDVVHSLGLMEMLKPNFGDLTVTDIKAEKVKDAHSLVSIKAGIKGRKSSESEKQTEILPKIKEERRKA